MNGQDLLNLHGSQIYISGWGDAYYTYQGDEGEQGQWWKSQQYCLLSNSPEFDIPEWSTEEDDKYAEREGECLQITFSGLNAICLRTNFQFVINKGEIYNASSANFSKEEIKKRNLDIERVWCLTIKSGGIRPIGPISDDKQAKIEQEIEMERKKRINYIKDTFDMIKDGKKQLILTGAPGTGKTHAALEEIARFYNKKRNLKNYFVQFHPSFDYVDFVEGLRPVQNAEEMIFVRTDGIFKSFCREIIEKKIEEPCCFIIDEINRADLSKVFGELMYCLEEGKRGKDNRVATQYQNIPTYRRVPIKSEDKQYKWEAYNDEDVFKDGFYIPENVIIIGTMNDIDRSVETFDFALRRRFHWIEAGEMDKDKEYKGYNDYLDKFLFYMGIDNDDNRKRLRDGIREMNKIIIGDTDKDINGKTCGLSEAYAIGPAYFKHENWSKVGRLSAELESIWKTKILPLLKEYCRGQDPDKVKKFCNYCHDALVNNSKQQNNSSNLRIK